MAREGKDGGEEALMDAMAGQPSRGDRDSHRYIERSICRRKGRYF